LISRPAAATVSCGFEFAARQKAVAVGIDEVEDLRPSRPLFAGNLAIVVFIHFGQSLPQLSSPSSAMPSRVGLLILPLSDGRSIFLVLLFLRACVRNRDEESQRNQKRKSGKYLSHVSSKQLPQGTVLFTALTVVPGEKSGEFFESL
jgi:hypothetical protein